MTPQKPIDLAVCVDIECTCDSPVQLEPMEVIEIACIKLDLTKSANNIDQCPSFHSYVKPKSQPQLTMFCKELTGITQSTIDKSDNIDTVTSKLINWLQREDLLDSNFQRKGNFAFASCGKLDQNILSPIISEAFNLNLPWINVKKTFVGHKSQWPKSLYHMLELLGEEPSGRLHSAQDDCKNLAKIVDSLHRDGCKFHVTQSMKS